MEEIATLHGYLNSAYSRRETVYSLNADTNEEIVPDDIPDGNYRIIRKTSLIARTIYDVIYVGRVADRTSDRGLKDRLMEHIGEWRGKLFFQARVAESPYDAYECECIEYHAWKDVGQAIYNDIHPAKLPDSDDECPICGE